MIFQGNAMRIPLADNSVQCVVTSLVRLLIELVRAKLVEDFIRFNCELRREWHKVSMPGMRFIGSELPAKCINLKTQFDLPFLTLNIGECRADKRNGFLLSETQSVIWEPATARAHVNNLCVWQERIDKLYRLYIRHCQFKANDIRGCYAILSKLALYTHMTLSVNHACKITDLPSANIKYSVGRIHAYIVLLNRGEINE